MRRVGRIFYTCIYCSHDQHDSPDDHREEIQDREENVFWNLRDNEGNQTDSHQAHLTPFQLTENERRREEDYSIILQEDDSTRLNVAEFSTEQWKSDKASA